MDVTGVVERTRFSSWGKEYSELQPAKQQNAIIPASATTVRKGKENPGGHKFISFSSARLCLCNNHSLFGHYHLVLGEEVELEINTEALKEEAGKGAAENK